MTKTQSETPTTAQELFRTPVWNTTSDAQGFNLKVEVPGVDREGVTITLDEDTLTIEAKRSDHPPGEWKELQKSIPTVDYRLKLQLVTPIDADAVNAQVESGILTVQLPLAPTSKPRKIPIN